MRHLAFLFFLSVYFDVTWSAWLPLKNFNEEADADEGGLKPAASWLAGKIGTHAGQATSEEMRKRNEYQWARTLDKREDQQAKKDPGKDDYGWGMMFGKRSQAGEPAYQWENVDGHRIPINILGGHAPSTFPGELEGPLNAQQQRSVDVKRGKDYGWGMMFGKRDNQQSKKVPPHKDYGWGMMFGKRSPQNLGDNVNMAPPNAKRGLQDTYGWGLTFGKRAGEDPLVVEMPDRDFDDYETDIDEQEPSNESQNRSPIDVLRESIKRTILNEQPEEYSREVVRRNGNDDKRGHNEYGWGLIFG
ncbi:uncharacterized protein [Ptychodera flava]|uniref:uncharacterized protein n=1 Tax=Ptychodera flava TaxID=63121 RepID=UPI00396A6E2F